LRFYEMLPKGNFGLRWDHGAHAGELGDKTISAMSRAGCANLRLDIEFGSENRMRRCNAGTLGLVGRYPDGVDGYFMCGHV